MKRALLPGAIALTLAALLAAATAAPQWTAPLRFRDWGRPATDGEIVVAGNSTGEGGVFALNARTGALLWKSAAGQQSGGAAIGEGLAFAEVGAAVRAFDLKTGRERWKVESSWRRSEAVTYDSGRVFYPRMEDGKLLGLNARTGSELWSYSYGMVRGRCPTPPVASGDLVLFGGGDDKGAEPVTVHPWGFFLHAVDAASGRLRWRFQARPDPSSEEGDCVSTPAFSGATVVTTSGHMVFAVDRASGRKLWQQAMLGPALREQRLELSAATIAGDTVVACAHAAVYGWSLSTGALRWTLPLAPAVCNVRAAPAASGSTVYVSGQLEKNAGVLYALEAGSGRVAWSAPLPGWPAYHLLAFPPFLLADTSNALLRFALN